MQHEDAARCLRDSISKTTQCSLYAYGLTAFQGEEQCRRRCPSTERLSGLWHDVAKDRRVFECSGV